MSSTQRTGGLKKLKERTAQGQPRGRWETLTDWARAQAAVFTVPIARALGRLGVHPNTVTILGLMLQVGVAVVFGLGYLRLGGWLLLVVAPIDALDGALARALGKQSRFGALLDSTLDRIADAVLILGLTAFYLQQGASLAVTLLLISLVATMLVSYVRARAEALGFACKVGLLTRMERILLIGALSGLGLPMVMIWLLTVLSVFTVCQRIVHIYAISRLEETSG
jgi:CDP-diacylglycerol--glycerol-3-phosphate 3-phosphatidyltransferase